MTGSFLTLFAAALLAASSPVLAEGLPDGHYRGTIELKTGRPLPVTLSLGQPGTNTDAKYSLRFSEPWACTLDLEYPPSRHQGGFVYSFTRSNGGPCNALQGGFMRLSPEGDGQRANMLDAKGGTVQSVVLQIVKPN